VKNTHSKFFYVTILSSISFLLTCCAARGSFADTISKSFAVRRGGTLYLESDVGSIEVQGAKANTVDIEVVREVRSGSNRQTEQILQDFVVHFDQKGDDVYITAKYEKRGLDRFRDNIGKYLRVEFTISVPDNYNLNLDTEGGSISAENIKGVIKSRTSGGSLHFDRIDGEISGRTSGGNIDIGEVTGTTDIETSGGSIKINRAAGSVDARTSGGSITMGEVMGGIRADTSGGSIHVTIARQPRGDCRLVTSGGSITVRLKDGIGMSVNAKTSGGRVSTDFPVTLTGEIDSSALNAGINGGGPELYLRTSGGNIDLRKY
jgi:DUF4097 and DUF4098 domain-containing protein YvlB